MDFGELKGGQMMPAGPDLIVYEQQTYARVVQQRDSNVGGEGHKKKTIGMFACRTLIPNTWPCQFSTCAVEQDP